MRSEPVAEGTRFYKIIMGEKGWGNEEVLVKGHKVSVIQGE